MQKLEKYNIPYGFISHFSKGKIIPITEYKKGPVKREVLPSLDTLLILFFIDLCAGKRWGQHITCKQTDVDFPVICFSCVYYVHFSGIWS
jgi:hypothetical protein